MKKYALIMAGGEGHRAGSELPKQFVRLLGIPMLWWSVRAFHQEDPETEISVVMHPGFFDEYDLLAEELPDRFRHIGVRIVAGGRTRAESVANGLMSLPDTSEALIAVHDAARPLVTPAMITRGWESARLNGAAAPVCPVTDSLRELSAGGGSRAVDRSRFVSVQTPQIVRADLLHAAYRLDDRPEFTDDASRVEADGHQVALYDGEPANIKVTNPDDFALAETLLRLRNQK